MSWAEVQKLKDKMSTLADATLYINVGKDYAGRTLMLKRYDSDYMSVTVGSQGTAEVSVQPKSRYELVTSDAADGRTSDVFYVEAGDYKEVNWDMGQYIGKTAVPINDVVILQKCAGIYNAYKYETLNEVIGDSACFTAICVNRNAVDYLKRCVSFITPIAASASAARIIASDNYCAYQLAIDTDWAILFTAPNSKAVNASTPLVGTYDAPATALSFDDITGGTVGIAGWTGDIKGNVSCIVDGTVMGEGNNEVLRYNTSTLACATSQYFYYRFPYKVVLKSAFFASNDTSNTSDTLILQGSDDGETWETIATKPTTGSSMQKTQFSLADNVKAYQWYRWRSTNGNYKVNTIIYFICSEMNLKGVKYAE